MNRRTTLTTALLQTTAAAIALVCGLAGANAMEENPVQTGVAGQSVQQDATTWDALTQARPGTVTPGRIHRVGGRWTRTEPPRVPSGAITALVVDPLEAE